MSGVFKLGATTIVLFVGADRNKVFNNLATQDLRTLASGTGVETFVTEPKGKTHGHGLAVAIEDQLLFVTVPRQAERLVPHFDRFIIMEDATVRDVSQNYSLWLAEDASVFRPLFQQEIAAADPFGKPGSVIFHRGSDWSGMLIGAPWIGPQSALLLVETDGERRDGDAADRRDSDSANQNAGIDFVCNFLGSTSTESSLDSREGWEAKRLLANWPWYGTDFDEKNLPQEIDRDALAISFQKGCYLGQETIARLDALGQVQKKLSRLKVEGDISSMLHSNEDGNRDVSGWAVSDLKVYAGDAEVGTVRSGAPVGDGSSLVMAFVKRSHFASGTALSVRAAGAGEGTALKATVL